MREAENTTNKDLEGINNTMIKETMTIDRRENTREDIDRDQMIIEVIYKYIHIILRDDLPIKYLGRRVIHQLNKSTLFSTASPQAKTISSVLISYRLIKLILADQRTDRFL